jgi:hypothetical protein
VRALVARSNAAQLGFRLLVLNTIAKTANDLSSDLDRRYSQLC